MWEWNDILKKWYKEGDLIFTIQDFLTYAKDSRKLLVWILKCNSKRSSNLDARLLEAMYKKLVWYYHISKWIATVLCWYCLKEVYFRPTYDNVFLQMQTFKWYQSFHFDWAKGVCGGGGCRGEVEGCGSGQSPYPPPTHTHPHTHTHTINQNHKINCVNLDRNVNSFPHYCNWIHLQWQVLWWLLYIYFSTRLVFWGRN